MTLTIHVDLYLSWETLANVKIYFHFFFLRFFDISTLKCHLNGNFYFFLCLRKCNMLSLPFNKNMHSFHFLGINWNKNRWHEIIFVFFSRFITDWIVKIKKKKLKNNLNKIIINDLLNRRESIILPTIRGKKKSHWANVLLVWNGAFCMENKIYSILYFQNKQVTNEQWTRIGVYKAFQRQPELEISNLINWRKEKIRLENHRKITFEFRQCYAVVFIV